MTTIGVGSKGRIVSQARWPYPLFLLVVLLKDVTKHPSNAALLGFGVGLEQFEDLTFNGNGRPLLRLLHWFVLLVHLPIYTLIQTQFHLFSDSICDFLKLYVMNGV
jgi:hypothetical protein